MVEEIIKESFTEDDIHKTIIEFCNQILSKNNNTTFYVSKIVDLKMEKNIDTPVVDEIYLKVVSNNKEFLEKIPRSKKIINKKNLFIIVKTKYDNYTKKESSLDMQSREIKINDSFLIGGGGISTGIISNAFSFSMGAFLKNKKAKSFWGLSCAHGVRNPQRFNYTYEKGIKPSTILLGYEYKKNDKIDFLLIKIRENVNKNFLKGSINHKIISDDIPCKLEQELCVSKYGYQTKFTKGKVASTFSCSFNSKEKKLYTDLIEIKPIENCNSVFSRKGDSGALVIDEYNRPVGLIKRGINHKNSLLVPIKKIFDSIKNDYPNLELIFNFN